MIGILGGTGYIGGVIATALADRGMPLQVLRRADRDYYQRSELSGWLTEHRVEFLINAAGFTGKPNVDACEIHKADCLSGNAVLPGIVRSACEQAGIPFAHVSSGCIFTGEKADGTGWTEQDPANFSFRQDNCSFYSGCKALGEETLEDCDSCYIWRLRIPFEHRDGPRNYLSKVMRYERLLDARNSLTHLDDFADSCVRCIEAQLPFGIYHLTNPGSVTTRQVTEMLGTLVPEKQFDFFNSESHFMETAASAPRSNCVLDASKAVAAGLPMRSIEDALADAISSWQWEKASA